MTDKGGRGATGLPLTSFARQLIANPTFRELWRVPVLVWESTGAMADSGEVTMPGAVPLRPRAGEPLVFEVREAPLTATAVLGVTVGRASNNDIVVNAGSVSRFHAELQHDAKSGQWKIGDASSSNGTFVRGERLKPLAPFALGDDEPITLGSVGLRFLSPAAFFDYLKALMAAKP